MIDEKKLIETIKKWQKEAEPEEAQVMDDIICLIADLPTAYDVEAVVRELEEKIKHHSERANYCHDNELYIAESEHVGKCEAFIEAIEIVKRGGRDE